MTTDPADTMQPSPMVTPDVIVTRAPIQQPSPMTIGSPKVSPARFSGAPLS